MQAFYIKEVDIFIRHFLLQATIPFSNNVAVTNTLCSLNIHFTRQVSLKALQADFHATLTCNETSSCLQGRKSIYELQVYFGKWSGGMYTQ